MYIITLPFITLLVTYQNAIATTKGNTCHEDKKIGFCIGERLWPNLENSRTVLSARNNSKIGCGLVKES